MMNIDIDRLVGQALLDIQRAANLLGVDHHNPVPWALVGGEALIFYGVPHVTKDADAIVQNERLEELAYELVRTFGWVPLDENDDGEVVQADDVTVRFMDDPVLFDTKQERRMIMMQSPWGLPVDLLAAQHSIEEAMIDGAIQVRHHDTTIPIAPLGGILLVKTKADRPKDVAAIEQSAEHITPERLKEALAWAKRRDPTSTEDLRSMLDAVHVRRKPTSKKTYRGKPR